MYEIRDCFQCGKPVELKTQRDQSRKKFCSRTCANTYNKNNTNKNLTERYCLKCNSVYKPKVSNQKYCTAKCATSEQVKRSYKYLNNNKEGYIKHLLSKKGRKHLSVGDIMQIYNNQEGLCNITKIPLTFIKILDGNKIHTNLSIDRIDSTKGYEIDNIQLVCSIINIMKSTLSMEEFIQWVLLIVEGGMCHSKF